MERYNVSEDEEEKTDSLRLLNDYLYLEDLRSQLKKLKRKIYEVTKAKTETERNIKIKDAEKCLKDCQNTLESIDNLKQDDGDVNEHDLNQMRCVFDKYRKNLDDLKSGKKLETNRNRLLKEGSSDTPTDNRNIKSAGNNNNSNKNVQVQEVIDIQEDNLSKLRELMDLNEDSIALGKQAAAKLKQQREKLELIQREVDELGSGLVRAKKEMYSIYKNVVCSKVVMIILVIISLMIVIAIILRIVLEVVGINVIGPNSIIGSIKNVVKK